MALDPGIIERGTQMLLETNKPPDILGRYQKMAALRTMALQQQDIQAQVAQRQAETRGLTDTHAVLADPSNYESNPDGSSTGRLSTAGLQKLDAANPELAQTIRKNQTDIAEKRRTEAIQAATMMSSQPGPVVSTPQAPVSVATPQPVQASIPTSLPGSPATASTPQAQPMADTAPTRPVPVPNLFQAMRTRAMSIPSAVGGPAQTIEAPYLEEANRRALAVKEADRMTMPPVFAPKGSQPFVPQASGGYAAVGSPVADMTEPTGDFEKVFLPARAQQLGKVYDPTYKAQNAMTPAQVTQATTDYAQRAQDPEARASAQALRELNLQLKELQIGQQPTREGAKATAEDIINHRIAPEQLSQLFGGFGTAGQAYKRMVMEEAHKIDPQFNYEQAASEYNLVKSPAFQQQIRFMDHVSNTLPRLEQSAKALGNTSVKALNALLVKGQEQFGGTNIKTFLADRDIVANELGRVLSGGGSGNQTSDAKIEQARQLVSTTDSPAQIAATIAEIKPLLASRRATLTKGTYLEGATAPSGNKVVNFADLPK